MTKPFVFKEIYRLSTNKLLEHFPAHTCKLCGKWEENRWMPRCMEELHENQLCFQCNFWQEKLDNYGTGFDKHFIIDGVCYLARNSKPVTEGGPNMRGFGGREMIILFSNNTVIKSSDVWCQGDVPPEWRDKLKDNAAFVHVEDTKWEDLPLIKGGHWK